MTGRHPDDGGQGQAPQHESQDHECILAGVSGAIAAPIAGRVADRGWSRAGTLLAILAAGGAFLLAGFGQSGTASSLGMLVAAAILLDFGVTTNLVLG